MSDTNSAGFLDALINALRSKPAPKAPPTNIELVHPAILGRTGQAQQAAQDLKTRQARLDQQERDAGL